MVPWQVLGRPLIHLLPAAFGLQPPVYSLQPNFAEGGARAGAAAEATDNATNFEQYNDLISSIKIAKNTKDERLLQDVRNKLFLT